MLAGFTAGPEIRLYIEMLCSTARQEVETAADAGATVGIKYSVRMEEGIVGRVR